MSYSAIDDDLTEKIQSFIPTGWTVERHPVNSAVYHLVREDKGTVSINFKERSFDLGWCDGKGARALYSSHRGHQWMERLLRDAIFHLKDV